MKGKPSKKRQLHQPPKEMRDAVDSHRPGTYLMKSLEEARRKQEPQRYASFKQSDWEKPPPPPRHW